MPRDPRLLVIPRASSYAVLAFVPSIATVIRPFLLATAQVVTLALVVALIALLRSPSQLPFPTKQPRWMVAAIVGAVVLVLVELRYGFG